MDLFLTNICIFAELFTSSVHLHGRRSINGCPLLRVCVHGVCVCSLLCVCVHCCVCAPWMGKCRAQTPSMGRMWRHFHKTLIYGLEWCGLLWFFISCLDSYCDGTHSLQRIHWWASDIMLNVSKSVMMKRQTHLHLGWPKCDFQFWLNHSFNFIFGSCICRHF